MATTSKAEILRVVNDAYPDSLIYKQAPSVTAKDIPKELLAKFLVAVVDDLYDQHSLNSDNLKRIALNIAVGAATLENVVLALKRSSVSQPT